MGSVAIHEAGHAAVALFYGHQFNYVTCKPELAKETLGHIQFKQGIIHFEGNWPPGAVKPRMKLYPEELRFNYIRCRVLLAGAAAENAMFGHYDKHSCSNDFTSARKIIKYKGERKKNPMEVHQEFSRLLELTKLMFKDRWQSPTPLFVKTFELSKAMFQHKKGTLTYQEAKAIYNRY